MKILTVSDIHADFDHFRVEDAPGADLCLMAGDLTEVGLGFRGPLSGRIGPQRVAIGLNNARQWLTDMGRRMPVFWVPGNHDINVGPQTFPALPHVHYVEHAEASSHGFSIVGVAMCPCYDMPFLAQVWDYSTANRQAENAAYDSLPAADIVISHCPPYAMLDDAYMSETGEWRPIGSQALIEYIDRHQPKLVVCGHAHGNIGIEWRGDTAVVNCAQTWGVFDTETNDWQRAATH